MVVKVGEIPSLAEPVNEIINGLIRKEELGEIKRPFFLVLSQEDVEYINNDSLVRSFFSSDTNRAYLVLVAASEPARTLFKNPPEPGEVQNIFGAGTRWGLSFRT